MRRFLVIVCLIAGAGSANAQNRQQPTTIPEMWNAWCARCHGKDGKGKVAEPTVTVEPLDFTDCKAVKKEGDPDWELAISKGGPAVGLSSQMPAFGDSLTPDQIRGFVAHLRTFCLERGWPDGNLNLPRPMFTEKAFPEDEMIFAPVASHKKGQGTSWSFTTLFERRIGKRFQLELAAPIVSDFGAGARATGFGDMEIGLKTVLNPGAANHLASFGFDFVAPTGDESRGLSEGAGFEPYFATASAWGTTYLQTQFKLELPKDRPWKDKLAVYRMYVGHDLNVAPTGWTVGVEFTGENKDVALTPQVRKGLSRTGAIAGAIGVRLPINNRQEQGVAWVGYLLWEFLERPYFGRR